MSYFCYSWKLYLCVITISLLLNDRNTHCVVMVLVISFHYLLKLNALLEILTLIAHDNINLISPKR